MGQKSCLVQEIGTFFQETKVINKDRIMYVEMQIAKKSNDG
jgi:hypothetical protein